MSASAPSLEAAPPGVIRVGLTGGIGSGKSTVAEIWRRAGIHVIDLDAISRAVLDKPGDGVELAVARFGEHLRNDRGGVDRAALAGLVFRDGGARRALESIVHSRVYQAVADEERRLSAAVSGRGEKVLVVHDSPLLLEQGSAAMYAAVVVVVAPREDRIERVVAGRGKTRDYVESIMAAQVSDKERRARATSVIDNDGSLEDLEENALATLEAVRGLLTHESGHSA